MLKATTRQVETPLAKCIRYNTAEGQLLPLSLQNGSPPLSSVVWCPCTLLSREKACGRVCQGEGLKGSYVSVNAARRIERWFARTAEK